MVDGPGSWSLPADLDPSLGTLVQVKRSILQVNRHVATVALVLLAVVGLPATAYADEGDHTITRYDVTADAAQNGAIRVTLDFDFDFGSDEAHGPYVTLPLLQEIEGDPDHYRSFDVTDVTASSSTGAPADVDTEKDGRALAIKVGDEDVEVEGVQSYVLAYTITGVVSPDVAASGQDEIFWNIIGAQWEVPLDDISVTLTGPAAVARTACFVGEVGSTTACGSASSSGTTATFTQPRVEPGSGLTVVVAYPAGSFVGAEPVLAPRRNLGNTFTLSPATGIAAGLVALVGGGVLAVRVRRGGRDQQYAGLTPGLAPAAGQDSGTAVTARDRSTPVAVQFTPPPGLRPGELGTLIDEVANPHDVTATIIDLAVRGHLRIEETTDAEGVPSTATKAKAKDRTWRLVKLDTPTGLLPYEQTIFAELFDDRSEVELDKLGDSFQGAMTKTQTQLYEAVTERGWFRSNPSTVRNHAYVLGGLVFLAGVVLATVLALTVGWGLVGVAVALVGIAVFFIARLLPARTPAGSAVLAQTEGFKLYLSTAEGDQLRFEEGDDVFSRYLPYAIAFGVAERWAKVFSDLAAQGHQVPEPTWYVGVHQMAFFSAASTFSDTLGAFSESAVASMTAASAGTSGGSGFSGGYSGGGVGGGGGGSW